LCFSYFLVYFLRFDPLFLRAGWYVWLALAIPVVYHTGTNDHGIVCCSVPSERDHFGGAMAKEKTNGTGRPDGAERWHTLIAMPSIQLKERRPVELYIFIPRETSHPSSRFSLVLLSSIGHPYRRSHFSSRTRDTQAKYRRRKRKKEIVSWNNAQGNNSRLRGQGRSLRNGRHSIQSRKCL
jgi:hypothetical protein